MRLAVTVSIIAAAVLGCGKSDAGPGGAVFTGTITVAAGTPTGTCSRIVDITFTAAGVSPSTVTVVQGECVRFVNSDMAPHHPESNPHIATLTEAMHARCPWLNILTPIPAGQSQIFETWTAGPPVTGVPVGACGHHDDLNLPPPGGGGY